jgi:hypothetical protein
VGKIPAKVTHTTGRVTDERLVTGIEGVAKVDVIEVRITVLAERGARRNTSTVLTDLSQLAVEVAIATRFLLAHSLATESSRGTISITLAALSTKTLRLEVFTCRRKRLAVSTHLAVCRDLTGELLTHPLDALPQEVVARLILLKAVVLRLASPLFLATR